MVEWIQSFLPQIDQAFNAGNPSGLLILCALAIVADIGIPIPFVLDTILILRAYDLFSRNSSDLLPLLWMVVALFVGRQIGSAILYFLARLMGKVFLSWLQRHFPSIGNRLDSFKYRLNAWAPLAICTARLTPGLLQITSVCAGAIRLKYIQLITGITASSLIYDGLLILLGFIAAKGPRSSDINFTIWLLIAMLIIVCILWPLIFVMLNRKTRNSEKTGKDSNKPKKL
jgi:membrane protein DedA with SNARE-associated domain